MRSKIFTLSIYCFFLAFGAAYAQTPETAMYSGSVGAGAQKTYGPFAVSVGGTAMLELIYDNGGSDLDIAVGYQTDTGIQQVALSGSEIRQFERLQVGVAGTGTYYVTVSSYRGASPFRLSLECACIIPSAGAAGQSVSIELKEAPRNSDVINFEKNIRLLQRALKK